MNRLKNYLDCRKIALAYLDTAQDHMNIPDHKNPEAGRIDRDIAVVSIIKAMRYLITANNNLQSLAFNQKPKRRKP